MTSKGSWMPIPGSSARYSTIISMKKIRPEPKALNMPRPRDLGVVIMEPLRGGNLGLPEPPPEVAAIWKKADKKRTPVEWALRWIWNRPEVTTVLSGMNEETHIQENLAIAAEALPNSLTKDELNWSKRPAENTGH